MDATGMKQGWTFRRGASRREGEKPWGRNVPGSANRGGVDSPVLTRRRGTKLHESCHGIAGVDPHLWGEAAAVKWRAASGCTLKWAQLHERCCRSSVKQRVDRPEYRLVQQHV